MNKLKITTLKEHSGLFNKVTHLVEESFEYKSPNKVEIDFANLFDSDNFNNNYLLINEDKYTVHGHIGFRKRSLCLGDYTVPLSIVGGISISKEYRGKGKLRELFEKVIEQCEQDSTFLFLWSDKSNLYQKFHFSEVGIVAQTGNKEFQEEKLENWEKAKLNDLTTIEIEELKDLYDSHCESICMIERDDQDWENLKKITSADFYFHRNTKNVIDMYFVMNKGQDLNGVIHEFGFKESCKKEFLTLLSNFKLWLPETIAPNNSHQYIYSAMIRIGNFDKFKDFVQNWSNGDINIVEGDLEITKFEFNGDEFEIETEKLLQYIWGPEKIKEFADYFKPLYISGLDSL